MGNSDAKYKAEARQTEAREQTARAKAAQAHELAMANAQRQREQQRLDHEKRLADAKAAHEAAMKKLENARLKADKDAKIAQKNESLQNIQNEINKYKKKIAENQIKLNEIIEKCKALNGQKGKILEALKLYPNRRESELKKVDIQYKYSESKKEFEDNEKIINGVIAATGVMPPNIQKFLHLANSLRRANLTGAEYNNRLANDIATFGTILTRECTDKLAIEDWFNDNNLDRLVPILAEEDIKYMDDLKCKDQEEYDEIYNLVVKGLEKQYNDWMKNKQNKAIKAPYNNESDADNDDDDNDDEKTEVKSDNDDNAPEIVEEKEPKKKISLMEKRKLENACMKPDTWEQAASDKLEATKETLDEICTPMAKFFERIDGTMKKARNILTFSKDLTSEQKKAIQFAKNLKPLAIENKDNDSDNENDEKNEIEDDFNDKQIIKIDDNNDIGKECDLINRAAIVSINVVESMEDEFDDDESSNLYRAKGMAISVQQNCMQIATSQGQIRKSLMLGDDILSLKPATFETNTSKKLWKAVDKGVILIYKNALNMVKISGKFFSFFLRFRQSFQYYLSNKDKTLVVSLSHLRKDIKEFDKFRVKLDKEIKKLDDAAIKCISDCVHTAIGASAFDQAEKDRARLRKKYLDAKKMYDLKETELNAIYDKSIQDKIDLETKIATSNYYIDSLNQENSQMNKIVTELTASHATISKMIF